MNPAAAIAIILFVFGWFLVTVTDVKNIKWYHDATGCMGLVLVIFAIMVLVHQLFTAWGWI